MWKMQQNHDAAPDQSITIAKGFVFYIILSETLESVKGGITPAESVTEACNKVIFWQMSIHEVLRPHPSLNSAFICSSATHI